MFKKWNIIKSYIIYEIAIEEEIMGIEKYYKIFTLLGFFKIMCTPLFCKNTTPLYPALIYVAIFIVICRNCMSFIRLKKKKLIIIFPTYI